MDEQKFFLNTLKKKKKLINYSNPLFHLFINEKYF